MAYSLLLEPEGKSYIRNYPGLSREGRITLFVHLDFLIREEGDQLCSDPSYRQSPGSSRLEFQLVLLDPAGAMHAFRIVVDDSAAAMGLLRVVEVEGTRGQAP